MFSVFKVSRAQDAWANGQPQAGKHGVVIITGKGNSINKAVTVAEITKRKLEGKVNQETDIYNVAATDVWEPVEENLDK